MGVYDLTKTTGGGDHRGYAFEKYEYSDSQTDGYRNVVAGSSNQNSYLDGVILAAAVQGNIFYALVSYQF
jgi:hypothetical protein